MHSLGVKPYIPYGEIWPQETTNIPVLYNIKHYVDIMNHLKDSHCLKDSQVWQTVGMDGQMDRLTHSTCHALLQCMAKIHAFTQWAETCSVT